MAKQRESFVKGCASVNNIPAAKANQIFDLLEKFAGYGFNKSHAAAYAIVAYQTAYLKANYPVEFFCAMMTNDMADTAKLSEYIAEARAMGIEVLPPDVNESQVHFAPAPAAAAAGVPPAEAVEGRRDACPTTSYQASQPRTLGHPLRAGGHQGRGGDRGGSHPEGAPRGRASSARWPTCASGWTAAR